MRRSSAEEQYAQQASRAAFALFAATAAAMCLPKAVAADVITDWGARGVAIGAEKQLANALWTRNLAVMHVAMFEAVNAIDGRYKPYKLALPAEKTASKDAAAAAAAHAVLISLYPDQKPKLDEALQASLATVAADGARTKGIELGKKAAEGIIVLRVDDGSNATESYRPFTKPGVYVPTALPIEITSGGIKPWVMQTGFQFRPPTPPTLELRGVDARRQRDPLTRRAQEYGADAGTDRNRPVLVSHRTEILRPAGAADC